MEVGCERGRTVRVCLLAEWAWRGHEERVWTKEYPKRLSQSHCLLKRVASVPYPDVTNDCEAV